MATYNNSLPALEALKQRDSILFGDKITSQSPEIQKLYEQNVATPYYVDGVLKGVDINKPYTLPTTSYVPEATGTTTGSGIVKDINSGLTNNDTYKQLLALIGGGQKTDTTSTDTTSPYTKLDENFNPVGPSRTAQSTADELIRAQEEALNRQYISNTANIAQQANANRQNVLDVGNRVTGSYNRLLGRAGAFTTSSGAQALTSQANAINAQINQLNIAENQALDAARVAYQSGKSDMLSKAMQNLDSIKKAQSDASQQKVQNLIDLLKIQQEEQKSQFSSDLATQKQTLAEEKQTLAGQKQTFAELQAKIKEQTALESKGWQYVSTPAERDALKAAGRSLKEVNGRIYVAPTKTVKTTKGGYDIVDSITNKKVGGQVPTVSTGGAKKTTAIKDTNLFPQVQQQLSSVVGTDGFISPQDYDFWRNAYIREGGSPTYFDTKAKGFRNPNNPNYSIIKQK